ncbi:MAG: hypothetical protein GXY38_14595 [Planctomycetes bacterium]|nr:hypothetical protein [Planctomycetota bacterium]
MLVTLLADDRPIPDDIFIEEEQPAVRAALTQCRVTTGDNSVSAARVGRFARALLKDWPDITVPALVERLDMIAASRSSHGAEWDIDDPSGVEVFWCFTTLLDIYMGPATLAGKTLDTEVAIEQTKLDPSGSVETRRRIVAGHLASQDFAGETCLRTKTTRSGRCVVIEPDLMREQGRAIAELAMMRQRRSNELNGTEGKTGQSP